MRAAITIEEVLMTFRLVAAAIAMQLCQQRGILLGKFVGFLYRTDELAWIERQARLRRFRRTGLRSLRVTLAAAMTPDADCSARIAIHLRTVKHRPQPGHRENRPKRGAENDDPSQTARPSFRAFLTSC